MSKRAEELSIQYQLEHFGPRVIGGSAIVSEEELRTFNINRQFKDGYEQAEKDLSLTADDIELIDQIFTELCGSTDAEGDEYYEKVLRMFNEQREKK